MLPQAQQIAKGAAGGRGTVGRAAAAVRQSTAIGQVSRASPNIQMLQPPWPCEATDHVLNPPTRGSSGPDEQNSQRHGSTPWGEERSPLLLQQPCPQHRSCPVHPLKPWILFSIPQLLNISAVTRNLLVLPIELKQALGTWGSRLDGHLKKSMHNKIQSHFMLYPPSPLLSPATINRLLFIIPLLILFPSFAFILVCVFFIFSSFNFFPNPFDHLSPHPQFFTQLCSWAFPFYISCSLSSFLLLQMN